MGRPLKEIDAEQVFKLARLGCTQEEIADFFDTTHSVISERFRQEYARARSCWKQSLRRAQTYRALKDRSDTMLIHLGKTYLGQTDRMDVTSGGEPVATRWFERVHNSRDSSIPSSVKANGVCEE